MSTLFQSTTGMQMESFLRQYGEKIKNKHILYAVTTNLEEDRQLQRGRTRMALGGVNIKIGKSSGNPYARLKSYTNMSSNFSAQFPQSGVRVLFVRSYQKRKDSESGKPKVDIAETLLKRALRNLNKLVPRRGSEIFNIDPQQLFDLIESIDTGDYDYDERRESERVGKRLLWMITDSLTGRQKLMYATDYDDVLRRYAEENDRDLMDPRSKYITQFYIKPVRQPPPINVESYSLSEDQTTPQQTTVQQIDVDMEDADESPYRVMPRRRIRFEDDDEMDSAPTKRRPPTIATSGRKRDTYLEKIQRPRAASTPNLETTRRRPNPPAEQVPVVMDFTGASPVLGESSKRYRSLKDILKDPRANKFIPPDRLPTSGNKRNTYRESIQRPRISDRDISRTRPKPVLATVVNDPVYGRVLDTTPPGFRIRDIA